MTHPPKPPSPWGPRPADDLYGEESLEKGMAALKGFDRFYRHELRPVMAGLEAERPGLKKRFHKYALAAAGVFAAGLLLVFGLRIDHILILVISAAASIGLLVFGYYPLSNLKDQGKVAMMTHLCRFLGLEYRQTPQNVSLSVFRELSLIPAYNDSEWEDQVYGAVEGVDFNLFEARLEMVTRNRKGRERRIQVFRGLLAEFDFHKKFTGTTLISRDYTAVGNFFGGLGKPGDRVRLEDPAFESLFEVYGTDQVESRYLLTPGFMERICALSARVGDGNLQLAFHRGNLLLAIKKDKDSFEGGEFLNNLADPALAKKFITDLALIYDIVSRLKLDLATRI